MTRRKRNYKKPGDGLEFVTLPLTWLVGLIGKLWEKIKRRKN